MEKKILVLVYEWNVDDGWYGQNYRYMLYKEEGVGFRTKGEANKVKSEFVKYINNKNRKVVAKCKDLVVMDESGCIDYKHVSCGPSYSCKNIKVLLSEVLE